MKSFLLVPAPVQPLSVVVPESQVLLLFWRLLFTVWFLST